MYKSHYEINAEDKASIGLASAIFALGLLFGFIVSMLLFTPLRVSAEELTGDSVSGIYSLNYSYMQNANSGGQYYGEYRVSFTSQYPLFFYQEKGDTWSNYKVGYFNGTKANIWSTDTVTVLSYYKATYEKNGNLYREDTDSNIPINGSTGTISVYDSIGETFTTGGFIFDSLDSATAYYVSGDASGVIQWSEPQFPKASFNDAYDPTMPVPQLGTITHAGFTVVNPPEGNYYLQVQVDSIVHGMQLVKKVAISDNTWVYAKNSVDLGSWDIPISNQLSYNLKNDWDYDNVTYFVEQLRNFRVEYPHHTYLPTYSFLKDGSSNVGYLQKMNEIKLMEDNLGNESAVLTYLNKSMQPQTIYYVRYVRFEQNETGLNPTPIYSQWISYNFTSGVVSISPVEGDASGKPISTNPSIGKVDSEGNFEGLHGNYFDSNGNYVGSNIGGYDFDTSDPVQLVEKFVDFIKQMPQLFGEFTLFLRDAFPFIPSPFWNFIYAGLIILVPLLIFKLLK